MITWNVRINLFCGLSKTAHYNGIRTHLFCCTTNRLKWVKNVLERLERSCCSLYLKYIPSLEQLVIIWYSLNDLWYFPTTLIIVIGRDGHIQNCLPRIMVIYIYMVIPRITTNTLLQNSPLCK